MTEIDTSKPSREFDAWIAEHVMRLEVVGYAHCWAPEGEWLVYGPTEPDTPDFLIRPVYVAYCDCDLPVTLEEREWLTKLHGHYTTCLAVVAQYTADIAAAWQVVEHLASLGWRIGLRQHIEEWEAWITLTINHPAYNIHQYGTMASSAPLAICRAVYAALTR